MHSLIPYTFSHKHTTHREWGLLPFPSLLLTLWTTHSFPETSCPATPSFLGLPELWAGRDGLGGANNSGLGEQKGFLQSSSPVRLLRFRERAPQGNPGRASGSLARECWHHMGKGESPAKAAAPGPPSQPPHCSTWAHLWCSPPEPFNERLAHSLPRACTKREWAFRLPGNGTIHP